MGILVPYELLDDVALLNQVPAVETFQDNGLLGHYLILGNDGLTLLVSHAALVWALHNISDGIGKLHAGLLHNLIILDDVDCRFWRNQCNTSNLLFIQYAVLYLHDVFRSNP
jgi:hypothetical protein